MKSNKSQILTLRKYFFTILSASNIKDNIKTSKRIANRKF